MKILYTILSLILCYSMVSAQETIKLYPNGTPGLIKKSISAEKAPKDGGITRISNVTEPSITIYSPKEKKTDAAVLICPGGGYGILAYDHEGTEIAEWFNQKGMTAVVLKYRLPERENFENVKIRPLEDSQTALRFLRKNATKYKISPSKIGIMGFSAGGHLAATTSTLFETALGTQDETISARPDFSILIYPVISMDSKITHLGSRENLLGKNPSSDEVDFYSAEKQVTSKTPPTFLLSTTDDFVVPENSIQYYLACKEKKVPVSLHIFEKGGHGYALKKRNLGAVETWPFLLENWLLDLKLLEL